MSTAYAADSDGKRSPGFANLLKVLGAIGFIIPFLLGYFEYRRAVQQDKANNFRTIVEKLSSDKIAERIAAASNLGTYLIPDEEYYELALDVLINTLSVELDYNVLNAIRGSLEKVGIAERKKIIQQLLDIDRNFFIYDYPLKTWLGRAEADLQASETKTKSVNGVVGTQNAEASKILLSNLKDELTTKATLKNRLEKDYSELAIHKLLVTNFIGLFLEFSRTDPIEELQFYQNGFNQLSLSDRNIPKSRIEDSAFSSSTLVNMNFRQSKIEGTTFAFSSFSNCDFSESEIIASNFNQIKVVKGMSFRKAAFDDVFFLGADLKGADFTGATGLKPVYFFKAQNLGLVSFDEAFADELNSTVLTEEDYRNYVQDSKLSAQRGRELLSYFDRPNP